MSEEMITGILNLFFITWFAWRSVSARRKGNWPDAFYQLGCLAVFIMILGLK